MFQDPIIFSKLEMYVVFYKLEFFNIIKILQVLLNQEDKIGQTLSPEMHHLSGKLKKIKVC